MNFKLHSSRQGIYNRTRDGKRVKATLRTYEVFCEGESIGFVEQFEGTGHRYADGGRRIITRTYHPLEWRWRSLDGRQKSPNGVGDLQRQDAARNLQRAVQGAPA